MTNDEAIKLLDNITSYCDFTDEYGDMIDSEPYCEALDMAIKALEQQPRDNNWKFYYDHGYAQAKRDLTCEDCISREAVLDTEYQIKEINGIEYVMLSEVQMKIRKMTSVIPTSDAEDKYDIGYNCGYADVMSDIAESEG